MTNSVIKNKTVSTRVTAEISDKAKANLAKQGLTISEYMRLALVKAANNEVRLLDFLSSEAALEAKHEAESGQVLSIGDQRAFRKWVETLTINE
jgi:DNA-damage-inducible protein J